MRDGPPRACFHRYQTNTWYRRSEQEWRPCAIRDLGGTGTCLNKLLIPSIGIRLLCTSLGFHWRHELKPRMGWYPTDQDMFTCWIQSPCRFVEFKPPSLSSRISSSCTARPGFIRSYSSRNVANSNQNYLGLGRDKSPVDPFWRATAVKSTQAKIVLLCSTVNSNKLQKEEESCLDTIT